MDFAPTIVASVITGILAVVGTFIASRIGKKGERENALIDQLQEQLQSADTRSDKQDERMTYIEARLNLVEKVSRIRLEYIYELRRHIANGQPPPAPDWPPGIHD